MRYDAVKKQHIQGAFLKTCVCGGSKISSVPQSQPVIYGFLSNAYRGKINDCFVCFMNVNQVILLTLPEVKNF